MSNFFDEQGRTRVCVEAYIKYAADENPRRTPRIGKRAISGWKLFGRSITLHEKIKNADAE